MDDRTRLAWEAERTLLRADVRSDAIALNGYFDVNFHEIGQSGRHWGRSEMIRELNASPSLGDGEIVLDEQRADALGGGLILLTYRLESGGAVSRRSSLWRVDADKPVIIFHQGTSIC